MAKRLCPSVFECRLRYDLTPGPFPKGKGSKVKRGSAVVMQRSPGQGGEMDTGDGIKKFTDPPP